MSPTKILDQFTADPHIKRSRQYLHYLRKVLKGYCGYGGCKVKIQAKYCLRHKQKVYEAEKRRREAKDVS